MAIKKAANGVATATKPAPINKPGTASNVPEIELTFVDEVPPATRAGISGRTMSPENAALIEALQANPGRPAFVDVRNSSQPNKTLRANGVREVFRRNDEGTFDRYAIFVGIENIPEPKVRGPRTKVEA